MKFEYDEHKSQINKQKHGIDFIEAQNLWKDEVRYALISKIFTKCFTVIFTIRDDTYRIISVRRCRNNEERGYENNNS